MTYLDHFLGHLSEAQSIVACIIIVLIAFLTGALLMWGYYHPLRKQIGRIYEQGYIAGEQAGSWMVGQVKRHGGFWTYHPPPPPVSNDEMAKAAALRPQRSVEQILAEPIPHRPHQIGGAYGREEDHGQSQRPQSVEEAVELMAKDAEEWDRKHSEPIPPAHQVASSTTCPYCPSIADTGGMIYHTADCRRRRDGDQRGQSGQVDQSGQDRQAEDKNAPLPS